MKFDPLEYYVQDPSDPNAPVFDTRQRLLRRHDEALRHAADDRHAVRHLPALLLLRTTYPALRRATRRRSRSAARSRRSCPTTSSPRTGRERRWTRSAGSRSDRYGYDRNYGILDQNWHRFAAKYNIWQQTHVSGTQCAIDEWRDANGNVQNYQVDASGNYLADPNTGLPIPRRPDGPAVHEERARAATSTATRDNDGTEDECQFYDSNEQRASTPARAATSSRTSATSRSTCGRRRRSRSTTARRPRRTSSPPSAHALNSWNIAVKRAAQLGKVAEANRVGGRRRPVRNFITSETDLLADQANGSGMTVPDIFVLCHNPVIPGDAPRAGRRASPCASATSATTWSTSSRTRSRRRRGASWTTSTIRSRARRSRRASTSGPYVTDTASQNVEDLLRWLDGEITNTADRQRARTCSSGSAPSKLSTAQYTPKVLSHQGDPVAPQLDRPDDRRAERAADGQAPAAAVASHAGCEQPRPVARSVDGLAARGRRAPT